MGALFVYILKSSVCLAAFYLFYRWLLAGETFHRFNRMALLGVLFLSLGVPCYVAGTVHPVEIQQTLVTWEKAFVPEPADSRAAVGFTLGEAEPSPAGAWSWQEIVLLIYLSGMVFFFLRTVYSLLRMAFLLRKSRKVKTEAGIALYIHDRRLAPFSWMNRIVVSSTDLKEGGGEILAHEGEHIRLGHSFDLLVAEGVILFQWFNPAAWLFKQELQNLHEYEADEAVLNQGIDAKQYQLLLIKKAVGTVRFNSLANSFNHSKLKKRITMMLKRKSNPRARLKYLYVLPLAAIAVVVFARPEVSGELDRISALKVNDLTAKFESKIEKIKPITAGQAQLAKSRNDLVSVTDSSGSKIIPLNKVLIPGKRYLIMLDGFMASVEDLMKISAADITELSLTDGDNIWCNYCDAKDGWLDISTKLVEQREANATNDLKLSGYGKYKPIISDEIGNEVYTPERVNRILSSIPAGLSDLSIIIDGEPASEKLFRGFRAGSLSGIQFAVDEKGNQILFVRTKAGDGFRKFKARCKNPLVILRGKEVSIDNVKASDLHQSEYQMYGGDESFQFGPKAKRGALFIGSNSVNYQTESWKKVR